VSVSFRSLLFGNCIVGVVLIAGCNTILDNKPAKYDPAALTKADPTEPTPPSADPSSPCSAGSHQCTGLCVDSNDPIYGCGDPSCTPCGAAHASAACQGGACAISACDKGYADCNNDPSDGCEVDLSKASSCGSCNAVCPAASPICAPTADGFQCGTGCTPIAPLLCGSECVASQTSVNHCGGCNAKCPDVVNAQVSCEAGACKIACKPSYHACAGACALDTDPLACGAACTVCPVPPNAAATCAANACAFQCAVGFADCNLIAGDGCESVLATDPLNCGVCGRNCNGGACVAGVCQPPPDAGP
jgi:hypothetical protein